LGAVPSLGIDIFLQLLAHPGQNISWHGGQVRRHGSRNLRFIKIKAYMT
jgi:hypothetical protein